MDISVSIFFLSLHLHVFKISTDYLQMTQTKMEGQNISYQQHCYCRRQCTDKRGRANNFESRNILARIG